MAKYKYVGGDQFLQGLPILQELDDETLTDGQKELLAIGVRIGLYRRVESSVTTAENVELSAESRGYGKSGKNRHAQKVDGDKEKDGLQAETPGADRQSDKR